MFDKYLKVPFALGIKEWNDWNTKTKKEHPIVWFFYNDVSTFFRRKKYFLERKYWKLQHTYNPKYKYNKLDTGLKPGYYDPSEQIKGAIFTSVTKYCKDNQFVWDETYLRCKIRIDLQNISDWHNIQRPKLENSLENLLKNYQNDDILGYFDCGEFSPDDRYSKQVDYLEEKIARIDTKMMQLAIKHLDYIWY